MKCQLVAYEIPGGPVKESGTEHRKSAASGDGVRSTSQVPYEHQRAVATVRPTVKAAASALATSAARGVVVIVVMVDAPTDEARKTRTVKMTKHNKIVMSVCYVSPPPREKPTGGVAGRIRSGSAGRGGSEGDTGGRYSHMSFMIIILRICCGYVADMLRLRHCFHMIIGHWK